MSLKMVVYLACCSLSVLQWDRVEKLLGAKTQHSKLTSLNRCMPILCSTLLLCHIDFVIVTVLHCLLLSLCCMTVMKTDRVMF